MLKVNDICVEYNGMEVLHKVSIYVKPGEFISVIGPNGAGKSSLLKTISGTVKCTSGEIYFMDRNVTKMEAHKRTQMGLIHIPEGRRVFPSLTVHENLEIGAYRSDARASAKATINQVVEIFPILKDRSSQLGGTLSGGEQQMLAIGRGLMANPRLLMLDEPSLGLSPLLVNTIFNVIRDIRKNLNFNIILVEQRAIEALQLCDRGYVLESGKVNMSSDRETLMGNPLVQKAYIGNEVI